jgi:hypothetical protein
MEPRMSDYLAAQITLGGCISRALVPRLCKLIDQAGLMLDWEEPFAPQSAEELLAARRTIDGEWLLQLSDDDAPYGAFCDLEAFLVKHEIPFDRQSDAGHGYDGRLVTYRPDTGLTPWLASSDGQPAVPAWPLWEALDALHSLSRQISRSPRPILQDKLQRILSGLAEAVPVRPSALRTFEIGRTVGLRKAA